MNKMYKMDEIHEIYQSRMVLGVMIVTCLLILGGCIQQPPESAKTPVAQEAAGSSNPYDYPIKPGTEEWEEIPGSSVIAEHTEKLLTEDNQQQANPNEPATIGENEYRVGESNIISGWRELKVTDYLYQLELGDQGMSWYNMSRNDTVSYTLHFPSEWTFNGFSIFNDREDNKVAELAPLAQTDSSMAKIFQSYQPLEGEPIAKEIVAFEYYEVLKLIEKVPVMYGEKPYWYPHTYLISDGKHLFSIIFYSYELSESDQEMYDSIARTFRFE